MVSFAGEFLGFQPLPVQQRIAHPLAQVHAALGGLGLKLGELFLGSS
jgi:hypothetical protein